MNDDLIKRSDAVGAIINHCENECYYRVDNWCPQCQREEFQEAIKAIPSADRPTGKWILSDLQSKADNDNGNYAYVCTNCNHTDVHAKTQKVPYCWWCGARMVKEANK